MIGTVINDDTLYETGKLSVDLSRLESSYANLPEDPYAQKGLRSRRYSRYRLSADGKLSHLSHEDFVQSSAVNKAVGDVERRFEEIETSTETDPAFVAMVQAFYSHTGFSPDSVVGAHQIRWHCLNKVMLPAPEGTHQDGFVFIAMFMVDAANLSGGEFLIYRTPDEAPILKSSLQPGEYLAVNDKKLFHDAAPLVPEANPEPGHWDLIVLTANRE
jgi:hypothetical protein